MSAITLPNSTTLQALTEEAVAHRESHSDLRAELFVPAIQSAQQIASQLTAYDLDGEILTVKTPGAPELTPGEKSRMSRIAVDEAEERRRYRVQTVSWRTGWKRERHSAPVIIYEYCAFARYLLWEPRNPDALWDLECPPKISGLGLHQALVTVELATADMLAQWAKDAMPLLEGVLHREAKRSEHLRTGITEAEATLNTLAI